tara:strand:- start:6845 stop:7507 length:663 start_codon:yes stop_codon:yes gene_type:complete
MTIDHLTDKEPDAGPAMQRTADGGVAPISDDMQAEETLEFIQYWEKEHKKIKDHADNLRKRADAYEQQQLARVENKLFFHTERLKSYAAGQLKGLKTRTYNLAAGNLSFRKKGSSITVLDKIQLKRWAEDNNLYDQLSVHKITVNLSNAKIKEYIEKTGEIPDGVEHNPPSDTFSYTTFEEDEEEVSLSQMGRWADLRREEMEREMEMLNKKMSNQNLQE